MVKNKELKKIILATILLLSTLILPINQYLKIIIYFISYYLVGKEVIKEAVKNIINKELFDENFLMFLATVGAFCIGEFVEGILVMLLYQIGELFQNYAVNQSKKSISSLIEVRPDWANIEKNGKIKKVNPLNVKVEDIILVKPGEKIPLDGIVIEGSSHIDKSYLTGESTLEKVKKDDDILSGCVNIDGVLKIKVTKEFKESTVYKVLDLIENASSKKASFEKFITRFAHIYTPIVVLLAIIIMTLLPLITNLSFVESLKRALTFLVISCPCALVISVPLSFFGGLGCASKCSILIKGSNCLEKLSEIKTVYFDKTGTLTEGSFEVVLVKPEGIKEEDLIEITAYAEFYSSHPIALSIKKYYKGEIDEKKIANYKEIAGKGIHVNIDKKDVYVGNRKLMKDFNIDLKENKLKTTIYVLIDGKYCGYIVIADKIKEGAKEIINYLKQNKINVGMLTGDNISVAKEIANKLKIDKYYAELLPQDKLNIINKENNTVFIGDGINDAPSLISADVGISMGITGTDIAIESSDIVIMNDDLTQIKTCFDISKKTLKIVKQNIVFSISIKVLFLILGAFGITNMMASVFADVGVSIIAILNAIRMLNFNKNNRNFHLKV